MEVFVGKQPLASTVFIIDDDAAMRDSLQALFEVRGLRVECFDNAGAFRARHDHNARGCLIVDLDTPDANGLALLRSLAGDEYRLPVIVLSS